MGYYTEKAKEVKAKHGTAKISFADPWRRNRRKGGNSQCGMTS